MIGAWPLIMGITMWLQMKLNPQPPDPVQAEGVRLDAGGVHLHARHVPGRSRDLLGVEQLLSIIQQSVIMSRQGVEIPLFENLGFKTAGNGKPASETKSSGQRAKADQGREKARQERGACHQSRKRRNTERAEDLSRAASDLAPSTAVKHGESRLHRR